MSLIGTLSEIKLADIFQLFAAGKKTGLLTASTPGRQALVRFYKGAVIHASAGRLQGDEAVLDIFGWKEGQLTFVPEEKVVAANVSHGVDVLIMEGQRLGDSFHKMNELIPTDHVVFQMAPPPANGAQHTVGATEWRVLRLLDGMRDLRELVEATKLPRAEVVRVLFEMTVAGFLEKVEVERTARAQALGRGRELAELDVRFEDEWRKVLRFEAGVLQVQVRTLGARKRAVLGVAFRPGLIRDIHLPKSALAELSVREGEDVLVRPVA
jgi:hypothetical protein